MTAIDRAAEVLRHARSSPDHTALVDRLLDGHPVQYGWRDGEVVMHSDRFPGDSSIRDRMNRCPVCEQWSPCDVRIAAGLLLSDADRSGRTTEVRDRLNRDGFAIGGTTVLVRKDEWERIQAVLDAADWLLDKLERAARPAAEGEELSDAEQTEQAYASMLLAGVDKQFPTVRARREQP